jgi:hypothetical protein
MKEQVSREETVWDIGNLGFFEWRGWERRAGSRPSSFPLEEEGPVRTQDHRGPFPCRNNFLSPQCFYMTCITLLPSQTNSYYPGSTPLPPFLTTPLGDLERDAGFQGSHFLHFPIHSMYEPSRRVFLYGPIGIQVGVDLDVVNIYTFSLLSYAIWKNICFYLAFSTHSVRIRELSLHFLLEIWRNLTFPLLSMHIVGILFAKFLTQSFTY